MLLAIVGSDLTQSVSTLLLTSDGGVTWTEADLGPAPTESTFSFDVENRSRVPVVVSATSDAGATMAGFEPGQRGTMSLPLRFPQNGVRIEVQGTECRLLASGNFSTPEPFTLLVEYAAGAGNVQLATVAEVSVTPLPLPTNALVGCGG